MIPLYKLTGGSLFLPKWSSVLWGSPCPCEMPVVIWGQVSCAHQLLASTRGLWHISGFQALAHSFLATFVSPSPAEKSQNNCCFFSENCNRALNKHETFKNLQMCSEWQYSETKPDLMVHTWSGRTSFSKSAPASTSKYRLAFCSLAKHLHWGRWDTEKLWSWSQYTSSSSSLLNTDICSAQSHKFSYSVLQKNWDLTGWGSRWSLNQSQRAYESWQTDCELGKMNLELKWWKWRGLGSSK